MEIRIVYGERGWSRWVSVYSLLFWERWLIDFKLLVM